jgi:hypothetical protein
LGLENVKATEQRGGRGSEACIPGLNWMGQGLGNLADRIRFSEARPTMENYGSVCDDWHAGCLNTPDYAASRDSLGADEESKSRVKGIGRALRGSTSAIYTYEAFLRRGIIRAMLRNICRMPIDFTHG